MRVKFEPGEGVAFFELCEVLGFVVGLIVLPEAPEDFEPAFAQAPQRTGMTAAFGPFGLIIGLGPGTGESTAVGPQMNGGAEDFVAGPPQPAFFYLATLVTDRTDAG